MAPFEDLYGSRCRFPIGCFEVGEAAVTRPDAVFKAMEKVRFIRERLKTTQSHQKSILSRVEKLAYEVDLPAESSNVYPVFHVSMLKQCIGNSFVTEPSEDFDIQNNLSFEEFPVEILDFQVQKLRSKEVLLVK
ncbi:uncharacterized protein LOC124891447, partial [Capsicum annuum]|uniref:uncharacterized protein LOC124891447 n=1 Tax=Capsicum annuum TaxID=4072 RepID=UPI001FB1009B